MDFNQYTKDAMRTESVPEVVCVNEGRLQAVMNLVIESNKLLDLLKRSVFYGTEIKTEDWSKLCTTVTNSVHDARRSSSETVTFGGPRDVTRTDLAVSPRLFHSIVGINTEAGELMELLKAEVDSGVGDVVNFGEEVADVMWYVAIGLDETNISMDTVLSTNIAKLKSRFPEKFDADLAVDRNVDAERVVLEEGLSGNANDGTDEEVEQSPDN